VKGKVVSDNLVFFNRPKELKLADPQLKFAVKKSGNAYRATIRAQRPALWVWADLGDLDARYSDNFIHLKPDESVTILIQPEKPVSQEQVAKSLRVRSLFDLA